jgi:uncharacterized protein (AIM24 family)
MESHEIEYRVVGEDLQFVEILLDPGETVVGEAGAMMYMSDGTSFDTKMGDGAEPEQGFFAKAKAAAKRAVTGEGVFMTHFTNSGGGQGRVAFASPVPGRVIPVDLAASGGRILAQKAAFLCAALGTKLDVAAAGSDEAGRKWMTRLVGGEGLLLQSIEGDGLAFLNAGGMVVEHRLQGEKLLVDTGCIVGFDATVGYSVEQGQHPQERPARRRRAVPRHARGRGSGLAAVDPGRPPRRRDGPQQSLVEERARPGEAFRLERLTPGPAPVTARPTASAQRAWPTCRICVPSRIHRAVEPSMSAKRKLTSPTARSDAQRTIAQPARSTTCQTTVRPRAGGHWWSVMVTGGQLGPDPGSRDPCKHRVLLRMSRSFTRQRPLVRTQYRPPREIADGQRSRRSTRANKSSGLAPQSTPPRTRPNAGGRPA